MVGTNTMEFRLQGDAHAHTVTGERMYVRLVLILAFNHSLTTRGVV
jgi:hypothetical protein